MVGLCCRWGNRKGKMEFIEEMSHEQCPEVKKLQEIFLKNNFPGRKNIYSQVLEQVFSLDNREKGEFFSPGESL